MEVVDILPVWM